MSDVTALSVAAAVKDYEDEFEDTYVYLEFEEFNDLNFFRDDTKVEFNGLESEKATCTVYGAQYKDGEPCNIEFSGRHEVSLGTRVFFPTEYNEAMDSNSPEAEDKQIIMVNSTIQFSLSRFQTSSSSSSKKAT
jgi:hypothetical protein